jgi:hypothetical protein
MIDRLPRIRDNAVDLLAGDTASFHLLSRVLGDNVREPSTGLRHRGLFLPCWRFERAQDNGQITNSLK